MVYSISIVGVDGGGCVSLTALGALDNGYHVIINTAATGTMYEKKQEKLFNKLRNAGAQI